MFAFLAFSACSSDDSDVVEPEPAVVGIETFGFYQQDNPEVLFADYTAEAITGTNINIALPEQVEEDNLVARFTTTAGDVVTVQGVTQISGETANNFSTPLEYLVTEEETNVIYTVSVTEMASAVWSRLPMFDADSITSFSLGINPANYRANIAYISDRTSSDDEKLNLIEFDGEMWNYIGDKDFSPARARGLDLAFNDSGVPYISFEDDATGDTFGSIMSYESDSWSYVGGGAFSPLESGVTTVSVGANNEVYGFYHIDQRGHAERRGVAARMFDGSWTDLPITGRTGMTRVLRSKEVNGDIYLGIMDYGEGQAISVYKYSNGTWTTLADKMKENPENTIYYYGFSMDVDSEGNVFVAYAENNGAGTDYQLRVKKYSLEDASWSSVGSTPFTSSDSINLRTFSIAADVYGNPILLYTNELHQPTVVHFDDKTNNWGTTTVLESVDADDLMIEVGPNGVAYAAYLVDDDLYVHKYDSPDNN